MRAYGMRGTPITIVIDARGRTRQHVLGAHDDRIFGATIGQLLVEADDGLRRAAAPASRDAACDDAGCPLG
jgi:hypothetical protein